MGKCAVLRIRTKALNVRCLDARLGGPGASISEDVPDEGMFRDLPTPFILREGRWSAPMPYGRKSRSADVRVGRLASPIQEKRCRSKDFCDQSRIWRLRNTNRHRFRGFDHRWGNGIFDDICYWQGQSLGRG